MPGAVTHYFFSLDVANKLNYPLITSNTIDAFRIGAQGPDILFFNNIFKPNKVVTLGHTMHEEKVYEVFNKMLYYFKSIKKKYLLAYISGFICHYALDTVMHPYINAKTHTIAEHRAFETNLDYLMLETNYSPRQFSYTNQFLKTSPKTSTQLQHLYEYIAHKVYHTSLPAKSISRSISSMQYIYSFLNDSTGIKKQVIGTFENIAGMDATFSCMLRTKYKDRTDILNIHNKPWPGLSGRQFDSFYDLLQTAEALAIHLIHEFIDAATKHQPLSEAFNKSFATGRSLQQNKVS